MKDRDNNLPKRDFIYTCPAKVFNDPSITINELKIYMMIRSFMDTTGVAYPSNKWLAEHLGINPRNTVHNINKLVSKGYLERIEENGKRFLSIPRQKIPDEGVSQKTSPHVADDIPPHVASDTQLDQSNIISKDIKNTPISPKGESVRFQEFWNLYPIKNGRKACEQKWNKRKLDDIADTIIEKLTIQVEEDDKWSRGFAPNPLTYINQDRWEDEISQPPIKSASKSDSFTKYMNSQSKGETYDQHGNTYDPFR